MSSEKESYKLGESSSLNRIAGLIKSGKAKNVVVLTGAGISTSAGIPDFRSPETGLYANLEKLNLPFPEAVFELNYFRKNPTVGPVSKKKLMEAVLDTCKGPLSGEVLCGSISDEVFSRPTPAHYFLRLLHSHGVLRRVFTQNIDTLETLAGLPSSHVIEAHGSFASAHCLSCRREIPREYVLESGVREGKIVQCEKCKGLVKPDIVFFGESLPERFFSSIGDLKKCDLLIIIGTSLQVHPFASLPSYVPLDTPRILINREAVGPFARLPSSRSASGGGGGLKGMLSQLYGAIEEDETPGRDVYWGGDADDGCRRLAQEIGWGEELENAIEKGREELEKEWRQAEGGEVPLVPEGTEGKREEAKQTAEKAAAGVKEAMDSTAAVTKPPAKEAVKEEDGWSSDEEKTEDKDKVDSDAVEDLNRLIASQLKLRENEAPTKGREEEEEDP